MFAAWADSGDALMRMIWDGRWTNRRASSVTRVWNQYQDSHANTDIPDDGRLYIIGDTYEDADPLVCLPAESIRGYPTPRQTTDVATDLYSVELPEPDLAKLLGSPRAHGDTAEVIGFFPTRRAFASAIAAASVTSLSESKIYARAGTHFSMSAELPPAELTLFGAGYSEGHSSFVALADLTVSTKSVEATPLFECVTIVRLGGEPTQENTFQLVGRFTRVRDFTERVRMFVESRGHRPPAVLPAARLPPSEVTSRREPGTLYAVPLTAGIASTVGDPISES